MVDDCKGMEVVNKLVQNNDLLLPTTLSLDESHTLLNLLNHLLDCVLTARNGPGRDGEDSTAKIQINEELTISQSITQQWTIKS